MRLASPCLLLSLLGILTLARAAGGDLVLEDMPANPLTLDGTGYDAANPPPGHLRSMFELPRRIGAVEELERADWPSPAEFAQRYAPPLLTNRKSPECLTAVGLCALL